MKALLISDHAKWCAKIMNEDKTVEVRKENVGKAIQKLIKQYGYADIYVYCTKGKSLIYTDGTDGKGDYVDYKYYESYKGDKNDIGSGKVVFKFRCYKVEEIINYGLARRSEMMMKELLEKSCLTMEELNKYAPHKEYDDNDYIYAIHISELEIFDEPKEISEFFYPCPKNAVCVKCKYRAYKETNGCLYCDNALKKAPQSMCHVEV